MRGIVRRFGPVEALRGADFDCKAGEVHALLGENGAGKTTLMHVLFGMVTPDAGDIAVRGRPVTIRSPQDALREGIGMVHQHFTQVPTLTVAENVWLGRPEWCYDARAARRLVERVAGATGLALDPDARAESLPVGLRQRLEIVKALSRDARLLILDEPTAALAPAEVTDLFAALRRLAAAGTGIILITHKLPEVKAIATRVTVLRRGEVVAHGAAGDFDIPALATAMIGPGAATTVRAAATGAAAVPREGAAELALEAAPVRVHRGEIVGIAAVEGNGQRALLRAVAREGTAFIPEDRHAEGLLLDFSLAENLALGRMRGRWIAPARLAADALALAAEFDIRPAEPGVPVRALSGGNQQKVVLARALAKHPALLIAENPTRGLDVHATAQVHALLRRAARERGMGVLFYSSDLDEVLALADRVAVMAGGTWRWVAPEQRNREIVGAMMLGRAA
jgi:general nucleoside transport system ATP-binding protein